MEQQAIFVVLCDYECRPTGNIDLNALSNRLLQHDIVQDVIVCHEPLEQEFEKLNALQGKKVIFAGGRPENIAQKLSMRPENFLALDMKEMLFDRYDSSESITENIFFHITSSAALLADKEALPLETITPYPNVLVYGSGLSGLSTALRLAREHIAVDLLDTSDNTLSPGCFHTLLYDPTLVSRLREEAENNAKITFIPDIDFSQLSAGEQGFLLMRENGTPQNSEYGTLVFAPERVERTDVMPGSLNLTRFYMKLASEESVKGLIVFLLDYQEEMTSESFKDVLYAALELRKTPKNEVWILSKQVQVALQGQEELYDECREAGVMFVKYRDDLHIKQHDDHFELSGVDMQVGIEFTIARPDMLVIPQPTTLAPSALKLAEGLKMQLVNEKYTQPDSLWRLPNETNRPGIFAVGSAHGNFDVQGLYEDVASGVLSVKTRLNSGGIQIEEHIPLVDEDKCAYCLTCVRVCPFGAMGKDIEERIAKVLHSACQACGICVSECPAEALQMRNLKHHAIYSGIANLFNG